MPGSSDSRRLLLAAVVVSLVFSQVSSAWAKPGTVHLKNGGWIEGEVLEVLPGERVSVRVGDGAAQQIPWAEVERVDQDQASAASAAAAAPTPAAPAAEATAAPATSSKPARPAAKRAVLSLDDPNTYRVVFTTDDTKIYLLGVPRSDPSSVALRLERLVAGAQLAECSEVIIAINGTASRHPLQHKLEVGRFATTETVQAQVTIDQVERMAGADVTELDLCGKKRALTVVHRAPLARFVKGFKSLIGKSPIVYSARRYDSERPSEVSGSGGGSLAELERERGKVSLGGPIALTIAGGVLALNGAVLLIYMALVGSTQDDICGSGGCEPLFDTTPFTVIGVISLVAGGLGLAVGAPMLSDRIKERRALGQRIKELRREARSDVRLFSQTPRLTRSAPLLTLHF